MTLLTPNFVPVDPNPRNPANSSILVFRRAFVTYAVWQWEFTQSERFRIQREREDAAAIGHTDVTKWYGTRGIPSIIPFHWSADKVRHFAGGGEHPLPAFIGKISNRHSVFGRPRPQQTGAAA